MVIVQKDLFQEYCSFKGFSGIDKLSKALEAFVRVERGGQSTDKKSLFWQSLQMRLYSRAFAELERDQAKDAAARTALEKNQLLTIKDPIGRAFLFPSN